MYACSMRYKMILCTWQCVRMYVRSSRYKKILCTWQCVCIVCTEQEVQEYIVYLAMCMYCMYVLYAETMLLTISHSNKNFLNCDRNYAALTQT